MPNYKGHVAGAITSFSLAILLFSVYRFSFFVILQWFIMTILGGLFPDIDTKSKGQKIFYRIIIVSLICLILIKEWISASFLGIMATVPLNVKHRGLFHKLWFNVIFVIMIVATLFNIFPNYSFYIFSNGFFFLLGIISHLWLDFGWRRMFR
ncbi:metal-dependent hydrolase [Candidatus Dependentiae bacterium]|nr:metal-dependent hydrolase [Candidatus Dependentiae bacterium]